MLRNLEFESVTWKDPWFSKKLALYGCRDKLQVPLIGLSGIISYTMLLMLRQFRSEQFIPTTHGLNHVEFSYGGSGYANQLIELSKIWKEPRQMDLRKHVHDVAPSYFA